MVACLRQKLLTVAFARLVQAVVFSYAYGVWLQMILLLSWGVKVGVTVAC